MPRIAFQIPAEAVRAILAPCKIVILLFLASFGLAGAAAKAPVPGAFDYYVLALSWSPTYCAGEAGRNDRQQCAPGRRFAFVVHGLWPQYAVGWPEFCRTRETWIPQDLIDGVMDVMPSKRLIIHQWKKHGSCSGLSQAGYYDTAEALFRAVKIPARYLTPLTPIAPVTVTPEQLVTDFVKSNTALTKDMLSVQCGNATGQARLSELRVCVNKQGSFTACGRNEARQCKAKTLVLLPVK